MAEEEIKTEITDHKVPVFLGWSGEASNQTAKVLHKYLPLITNALDPFISDEDIEKGSVWRAVIAKELEKSECGILCLTPENVNSLWIHFEAGALSKRFVESRACTFLMGLTPSEFDGPLTDFQSTAFDKEDFFKLVNTLNSACGSLSQSGDRLKTSFDIIWPKIEEELTSIEKEIKKSKPIKTSSSKKPDDASTHIRPELLEELVSRLRSQDQTLLRQDQMLSHIGHSINADRSKYKNEFEQTESAVLGYFFKGVQALCNQLNLVLISCSQHKGGKMFFSYKEISKTKCEKLYNSITRYAKNMGFKNPRVEVGQKDFSIYLN